VFPDAGGVLVVLDVVVCAVPPLVEPVLGVDEVVVDAPLLLVVAAEVTALVVLEVVMVVVVEPVEPVDPVDPAVPLVPVGPRLSSGLVIVGVRVGELAGTSSEICAPPHAASARPHSVTAPTSRGLISAAAAFDGRRWGSR
jgi:hypothetical protein